MPGSFLIAEDYRRLLCEFTAGIVPGCEPAAARFKDADYDPLRLRPVADVAFCIDKLLGVASDVPIAWRLGEYWAANASDLLIGRALSSTSIGEALEVAREHQSVLTNTRTISHMSRSDGGLAAIHNGESAHDPIMRFLFHSILATKLSHTFKLYTGSERQHRVDLKAGCFGSLMQRFDRELDFVDVEFRESEATFGFSRNVLNYRLPDRDERLRIALDCELRRKAADVPVTGRWKGRIEYYIRSNHLSDISLDEVCDKFRVQRRTLGRQLRSEGTTFSSILKELRRERALHLVRSTAVPLKRVASELGFNSDASFSMAFKGWTGMTPMSFRKAPPARQLADDAQPTVLTLAG